ncbi:hypothetical protein HmCmsJML191_04617 [Escherichia coli]|nr:hypothetical protein A1WA_00089 [Escherichia coli KTE91]ELH42222.1 hypothetical protein A13E_00115 [Escherichia coli KTE184]ELJ83564.1 hypothetical protein WGU_01355 [Escherichia coli KTE90]GDA14229.1 hypothetical protein HmCmsJML183_04659 [Escherichia coli]GDC41310.1 hypothetical protein HmCmsJML191_04617 [Escherichia coli]
MKSVPFRNQHCYQLASTYHHSGKNLPFGVGYSFDKALPFWMTVYYLGHLRQHFCINPVGLCQISHSTREIPGLSGIDDRDIKTFSLK